MRSRAGAFAATLAVALLATSCSIGGTSPDTAERTSDKRSGASTATTPTTQGGSASLRWMACQSQNSSAVGMQCSNLQVPLDPARPDGEKIQLALARVPSKGRAQERIGSIILNPGGPGGSGIDFLASAAGAFPKELTERFDLVSFDPRGVAESSPVRCLDDKAKAKQLEGDLSPDTPDELKRAIDDQKSFLAGCKKRSSELLTHMSTADVAADLDQIREAVGDEKLTYVGFSYGTSIGAVYATLFPNKTRALVLDGSVSPVSDPVDEAEAQAKGFEHTLANFVSACDADKKCAIGPDAASVIARTRVELTDKPIKVTDKTGTRELGVDLFDLGLASALYDTSLWGATAGAIDAIHKGGAEMLLSLGDRQTGRQPDGTFDNSSDAQSMVSCADETQRPSLSEAEKDAERIRASAPTFGEVLAWTSLSCLNWPKADNPLPKITGAGSAPILVVGTLGDPATPYSWAQQMTQALESARLLTYEGDGHTAFLRGGACINNAVSAYLVDLTLPSDGTSCPAAKASINFGGLSDEVINQLVQAGLPRDLAQCVIDGLVKKVGLAEFNRMVLDQDTEAFSKLVTAQTMSCVSSHKN